METPAKREPVGLYDLITVVQKAIAAAPQYEREHFFSSICRDICSHCFRTVEQGERCYCWRDDGDELEDY